MTYFDITISNMKFILKNKVACFWPLVLEQAQCADLVLLRKNLIFYYNEIFFRDRRPFIDQLCLFK